MTAQDDGTHRSPEADQSNPQSMGQKQSSAEGKRMLDAKSQSTIEERLRTMFDNVAQEPVPDRFLELLNKLENSEGSGGGEPA